MTRIFIAGAGLMGTAIAAAHIHCGFDVVLYDTTAAVLAAAAQRTAEKLLEYGNTFNEERLLCSGNIGDAQHCNIVIETITEKLRAKRKLYKQITAIGGSSTLLLTNTSTISITTLAETLDESWQQRFCGFHFFHPVRERALLELIPGKQTSTETAEAARQHAIQLGKKPITVADAPGFLVNRILQPYLSAALELLERGIPWQDIDRAALNFGMKHGPCTLMDEIGLDVVLHSGWTLYKAFPDRVKPMPLLLQLVEQGHLGVKAGYGIRETDISDGVAAKCDDEIISFLLEPMYNEALRCYRDGIIGQLADADLASVEALGFPPDKIGIETWGSNHF